MRYYLIAIIMAGLASSVGAEGLFSASRSIDVQRHTGLDLVDADKMLTSLRERNRRVIDVEVRLTTTCAPSEAALKAESCTTMPIFDLLSEPNPGGGRWIVNLAESDAQYAETWKSRSSEKYRLADIEPHSVYTYTRSGPVPKRVQFTSLWVQDAGRLAWASYSRLTSQGFSDKFRQHGDGQKMAVTDYETYELVGADCPRPTRYSPPMCVAAIFTRPPAGAKWAFLRNLSPQDYLDKKESYERSGFRTLLLNNQWNSIAATFLQQPDAGNWKSFARMTEAEYTKIAGDMRGQGYRLVDFEMGHQDLPNTKDISFGSIWYKPPPRSAPRQRCKSESVHRTAAADGSERRRPRRAIRTPRLPAAAASATPA